MARSKRVFRFGVFEVDAGAGELRKQGVRIKLQDQPFQLLLMLLERPGEIVSREEIRRKLWPPDTFVDFDQAVHTALKKLRQALGDDPDSPRYIETLPRKGYRFIAPINGAETAVPNVAPAPIRPAGRYWRWILASVGIAVLAFVASWLIRRPSTPTAVSTIPVPLTTYPGQAMQASFSPDGNQVAFAWNSEKQDNFDIYVKLIGSESLLRITTDPAVDFSPAWSPDGRSIAFLRQIGSVRTGVFLVPAIGGPERKIAEINRCKCSQSMDSDLAWSPDGKWLATVDGSDTGQNRGLILLSLDDGEKRRLTSPGGAASDYLKDINPAFSPDGKKLAFIRQKNPAVQDIYLLSLSTDGRPKGEPVRVTFNNLWAREPAWSPDGREIIFTSGYWGGTSWLWRLSTPAVGPPERLAALGDNLSEPSLALHGNRLAFTHSVYRLNTWRLELSPSHTAIGPPVGTLLSTRIDYNAQYSPDGKHIVFHSTRSGGSEIWVSDSDGSNPRQLTFLHAPLTGSPRWSPDGTRIVFDSNAEGQFELYLIAADGGKPRRLTNNRSDDGVGSWSHDGKWIYFGSNRSGQWQVWKMPLDGGNAVQVTRHGGYVPFESADGRFVYYSKGPGPTTLWRVPASGGPEEQVLQSVRWLSFAVVPDGIYFVPGPGDGPPSIQFFDFRTGTSTVVASIQGVPSIGLSVSPDERHILYSQVDLQSSDLMLVENFR